MPTFNATKSALALSLIACGLAAPAHATTEADLILRIERMAQELSALRAEVQALKAASQSAAVTAPVTATAAATPSAAASATRFTGYGEINVNAPTESSANTQADLSRFVLGFEHRFDPKTTLVAEIEWEHAVTSADDAGETALEQAYIERQINQNLALRGGLFVMPIGLLNPSHEPTNYFGVERNFVETAIIPSTLREGGIQAVMNFSSGLSVQTGISTGPDISKWEFSGTEGSESPLGSIHQELSQARARDLNYHLAANWQGIPGLLLGASVITGDSSHGASGFPHSRITLWDTHARYSVGAFTVSGLYAQGRISNTARINATAIGMDTLIPERFDGGLLEASYKVWQNDAMSLTPFIRYEQFNTGRSYADLGAGVTPVKRETETVYTIGANWLITPEVVLKVDYQDFDVAKASRRFDLGLGWAF